MSSKSTSPETAADAKGPLGISPLTIVVGILVMAAILLALFFWIRTAEPPCSTCHIERNVPKMGSTVECRLNGRIREDWGSASGSLFAGLDGKALIDTADPDGYLADECLDVPIKCPELEELKIHFFNDENKVWPNPICKGVCPHCPK